MRRLLSLWLPDFACERRLRALMKASGAAPAERAVLALLRRQQGRLLLAAVTPAAAAEGLRPGQTLAAARALLPDLQAEPEAPAADRAALRRLADWCRRYTPWVALDPDSALGAEEDGEPGFGGDAALWLDITGCAHLLGGEAALARNLLRRLVAGGVTARLAIAATPGAAWALARYATTPAHPTAILPPEGELASALAPLPVAGLRLAPETLELLRRLGLERIGELQALPPATLTPRFGPLPAQRLRQALGQQAESLAPDAPEEPLWVRRAFAEPVSTPEDLARIAALLFQDLAALLERRGLGARRLELAGHRVDGTTTALSVGLGRPNRSPDHWRRLFRPKLERLDPGFGIEVMTLAARLAEPLAPEQARLPQTPGGQAALRLVPDARPAMTSGLAALLDRLENRLGAGSVRRLAPQPRHWPEDAVLALSPAEAAPEAPGDWPLPRPLYLLRRPERLEFDPAAAEGEAPPRRFHWRRRQLALAETEGPERLTPAWWQPARAEAPPRDYWRVEDREGRRYWLYREALPEGPPRWFLHGLFA